MYEVHACSQVVAIPKILLIKGEFYYVNGELGQISDKHGVGSSLLRGPRIEFSDNFNFI